MGPIEAQRELVLSFLLGLEAALVFLAHRHATRIPAPAFPWFCVESPFFLL